MFTEEINKINGVSAETKNAIARKSAQTLPTNPSERGYSAEEIKRRFYQPILDAQNSTLAEIDRMANEINVALGQVDTNIDTFLEKSRVNEPYKITLDEETWQFNEDLSIYELKITKEQHGIEDYKEIGVDMFLLDEQGNYTAVNQFEVLPNGTVRCFHETNGVGYLNIYTKREGYVWGDTIVDVDHVIGLSKVGASNDYEDLDNKPNLQKMYENEQTLSNIISGSQKVTKAINAENAESATYAKSSGTAGSANNAQTADKATADQFGVNIATGYCKQNGNYPDLKSGNAAMADSAKADEDGINIKTNYAKQNGTYSAMTVGKATNAEKADSATKASQDGNGANIVNTYATKTGNYQSMTVGNATKANQDENGLNIVNTYATKTGNYQSMTVGNATFAQYAGQDKSKGTIEERLTRLGFKQGSFGVVNASTMAAQMTIKNNEIKKQGNYCLANLLIIFESSSSGAFGANITIPTEFRPKQDYIFEYGTTIHTNGSVESKFHYDNADGNNARRVTLTNVGWECNQL